MIPFDDAGLDISNIDSASIAMTLYQSLLAPARPDEGDHEIGGENT
jgi:hypothetical protein